MIRGTWDLVIGEHDTVSDEHLVFKRDPLADKTVGRNLAACADGCPFLNLDKCPNFGVVANLAPI